MGRFSQTVLLGLAVAATSVSFASGELTVIATSDKPITRVGLQNFEEVGDNDDVRQEGDEYAAALAEDELVSGERHVARSVVVNPPSPEKVVIASEHILGS